MGAIVLTSRRVLRLGLTLALLAVGVAAVASPIIAAASPTGSHAWIQLDPATSAPARGGHVMAADPAGHRVGVFGL